MYSIGQYTLHLPIFTLWVDAQLSCMSAYSSFMFKKSYQIRKIVVFDVVKATTIKVTSTSISNNQSS